MKQKKRLKYRHQAHCTPCLLPHFSHTQAYIYRIFVRSLETMEMREISREMERDVQKERKEDLASFLSEELSNHHATVTSSRYHLTISASLLIVSLFHGSVLLPSVQLYLTFSNLFTSLRSYSSKMQPFFQLCIPIQLNSLVQII